LEAELLLSFEQHLGRLGSHFGSFHHAERAPRVVSSLTAGVAHNQKHSTTPDVDISDIRHQ
jgi:hypothetical protein